MLKGTAQHFRKNTYSHSLQQWDKKIYQSQELKQFQKHLVILGGVSCCCVCSFLKSCHHSWAVTIKGKKTAPPLRLSSLWMDNRQTEIKIHINHIRQRCHVVVWQWLGLVQIFCPTILHFFFFLLASPALAPWCINGLSSFKWMRGLHFFMQGSSLYEHGLTNVSVIMVVYVENSCRATGDVATWTWTVQQLRWCMMRV